MINMNFLDLFWIFFYIIFMIVLTLVFYKLAKKGQESFFLANRDLSWWMPAISVYGTHTATDTPVWISGVIYTHGLRGLWYTFFSAWCALSAFISTKIFRRSMSYTQAEYQKLRFGGLGSELLRGWIGGWQIFMNMFVIGWVSIAMGKVCSYMFGWPIWVGGPLFTILVFFYVLISGYWGVIVSELQQGIVIFAIILIVSFWGIFAVGGPSSITGSLQNLGESWRLNPFFFDSSFTVGWFLTMLVIAIIGGVGMGTSIDWYPDAQRVASTRSIKDAAYAMWAGGVLVVIRNSLWAVAILAFYVAYPFEFSHNGEMAWYRLGIDLMPHGLLGFFFVAIVAIHFSTISAHLNLGAMYATRDVYHHYIAPEATEKRLVWVGRINTLIILIGSLFFSLMIGEKITSWLIYALWLMAAGLWLPNILQVIWWRFNSWGYLSAWIANLAISWLIVWILPSLGIGTGMTQEWQFWWAMILCLPIYLFFTYITKPEDKEKLAIYYAMTRPLGFWKPIREIALQKGYITEADDAVDSWGARDFWGCVFSVLSYGLWMLGIAWLLLNDMKGWIITILAIISTIAMYKILNKELIKQSDHFETKQEDYKRLVENSQRWINSTN